MFSKLSQLERKLSNIHLEDLQHLHVNSPDHEYVELLSLFFDKYSQLFRVIETLGDMREPMILTLICKLSQVMSYQNHCGSLSGRKREVVFYICETLRICFREDMSLSAIQIENLLISLLSILKTRLSMGIETTISATRCLINVLNQHPDRMIMFSSSTIDGLMTLVDVIQKSFPFPQSLHLLAKEVDEKGAVRQSMGSEDKDSTNENRNVASDSKAATTRIGISSKSLETFDEDKFHHQGNAAAESKDEYPQHSFQEHNDFCMQEIQYCVKIIYMMLCQSEEIHQSLKSHRELLKSLIYRLTRCIVNNHSSVGDSFPQLKDFPYSTSNATLCQDIYKLLYALESYEQLEKYIQHRHYYQDDITIESDFLSFIIDEDALLGWLWKTVGVSAEKDVLLDTEESCSTKTFMESPHSSSRNRLDEIEGIRISFAKNDGEIKEFHTEANMQISYLHKLQKQFNLPSSASIPSPRTFNISSMLLFHVINMIVLTISPLDAGWFYIPPSIVYTTISNSSGGTTPRRLGTGTSASASGSNTSAIIYTGSLLVCEEYCIQNLSLVSHLPLQSLFSMIISEHNTSQNKDHHHSPSSSSCRYITSKLSTHTQNLLSEYRAAKNQHHDEDRNPLEKEIQQIIQQELYSSIELFCSSVFLQRKPFLSNTLLRLLVNALLKSKQIAVSSSISVAESNAERVTMLAPILMVCLKLMKVDISIKQYLQRSIFPNAYSPASIGAIRKDKNLAPTDCPEGSIRHLVISYMISLDSQIKRCINEFLFYLCNQDADEFIYRTGYGNAIAYLQTRGLI